MTPDHGEMTIVRSDVHGARLITGDDF